MSEEDLELLVTLDDPEGAPEEDTFHHLSTESTGGFAHAPVFLWGSFVPFCG